MCYNKICSIIMVLLLTLSGCAGTEAGSPAEVPQSSGTQANNSTASRPGSASGSKENSNKDSGSKDSGKNSATPAPSTPFTPYQAPEYAGSSFHADLAEGDKDVKMDFSAINQGYVALTAKADNRVKMKVIKGDIEYVYNVPNDETPSIVPLQCGDGEYTFQVFVSVPATGKYTCIYQATKNVKLDDEFQPFLRPSDYVNYNENSKCVRKAAQLAKEEENALGVVNAVYKYICENIDYDVEKAKTIQSNPTYLPDPDEIMQLGMGICFDYAALAAAMLRSQGIPTKMIWGNVLSESAPEGYAYHAWNMFYTEETGWVAVEYSVKTGDWNRLDLTFSAGGAPSEFVGDGDNYTDLKCF